MSGPVGVSHVAIGVTDMDRSLPFYRDLMGMQVTLDRMEGREHPAGEPPPPDAGGLNRYSARRRRAVYLRWDLDPQTMFVVLSAPSAVGDELPLRLDQLGIHHFGFWVNDLERRAEVLASVGVRFRFGPAVVDTGGYGEANDERILTCIFEDPDGILLQFDQRLDGD
ncbi:MAG: VOC family protein [Acidimicrobiales bacterium]|nr:VOC family protein [Acidimicrobiales bacterium]